jgi:hypothetical protein
VVVVATKRTTKKAAVAAKVPADHFIVVVRGNQYYIVNRTGATVGGPYRTRVAAEKAADVMEQKAPQARR